MSLEGLPVRETGNNNKKYQYANHWEHTKNGRYYDAPPLEVLNLLFEYDAETGSFKRRFDMRHDAIEPREITYTGSDGYRYAGITDSTGTNRKYLVHRLAWVMQTGQQIPMGIQIDHQDGNPLNNRFENFRIVSHKANTRNQSMNSKNTSGYTGVSWHKQSRKWKSQIKIDGKHRYIGLFETPEEANAARLDYVGRFNLENLGECFSYRHTNTANVGGVPESISM